MTQTPARPATTISYLRMDHPPDQTPNQPTLALEIQSAKPFPAWYFLALYQAVGADFHWTDMLECTPEELDKFCHDNNTLYTLMKSGVPAGFYVLHEQAAATDLAYFGLTQNGQGHGLGGALLDHAIAQAWSRPSVTSVTVNTCTLDHPRALPLYLSRGFVVTKTEARPARASGLKRIDHV